MTIFISDKVTSFMIEAKFAEHSHKLLIIQHYVSLLERLKWHFSIIIWGSYFIRLWLFYDALARRGVFEVKKFVRLTVSEQWGLVKSAFTEKIELYSWVELDFFGESSVKALMVNPATRKQWVWQTLHSSQTPSLLGGFRGSLKWKKFARLTISEKQTCS